MLIPSGPQDPGVPTAVGPWRRDGGRPGRGGRWPALLFPLATLFVSLGSRLTGRPGPAAAAIAAARAP